MRTAVCLIGALSTNGAFPRAARHSRGVHAPRAYNRGSALPIAYQISSLNTATGPYSAPVAAAMHIRGLATLRVVTFGPLDPSMVGLTCNLVLRDPKSEMQLIASLPKAIPLVLVICQRVRRSSSVRHVNECCQVPLEALMLKLIDTMSQPLPSLQPLR